MDERASDEEVLAIARRNRIRWAGALELLARKDRNDPPEKEKAMTDQVNESVSENSKSSGEANPMAEEPAEPTEAQKAGQDRQKKDDEK